MSTLTYVEVVNVQRHCTLQVLQVVWKMNKLRKKTKKERGEKQKQTIRNKNKQKQLTRQDKIFQQYLFIYCKQL